MREIFFEAPVLRLSGVQIASKSQKRYDSGFSPSLTLDEALHYFAEECALLPAAARITLYTNYERITVSRLRQRLDDDSSACCEIVLNGKTSYLLSHQWGLTEQNIYAIHLTLRALHNIVKWGLNNYESLLQSFSLEHTIAISQQISPEIASDLVSRGQWLAILRLEESATLSDANAAYRFYAKQAANSEEGLLRLNQAIESARRYFEKNPN